MKLHANAAMSLSKRRRLCERVLEQGWTPTKAAGTGGSAIPPEEAELTRVLGDGYRAYQARTKRLIPGLW